MFSPSPQRRILNRISSPDAPHHSLLTDSCCFSPVLIWRKEDHMPTHILRIASLVTVSCAALCACSANIEEAPSSAWAHELQTAREEVDGESSEAFVLQVLADDVVSDAEIEEAGIRMESCMHDRGYDTFSYRPRDQNFGELGSPERWDAEAVESDRISCAKQTGSSVVSYLWSSMRSNPQNIDPMNYLFRA